jgi:hypothetical protein
VWFDTPHVITSGHTGVPCSVVWAATCIQRVSNAGKLHWQGCISVSVLSGMAVQRVSVSFHRITATQLNDDYQQPHVTAFCHVRFNHAAPLLLNKQGRVVSHGGALVVAGHTQQCSLQHWLLLPACWVLVLTVACVAGVNREERLAVQVCVRTHC